MSTLTREECDRILVHLFSEAKRRAEAKQPKPQRPRGDAALAHTRDAVNKK